MIGCELSDSLLSGFTKVLMASLEGGDLKLGRGRTFSSTRWSCHENPVPIINYATPQLDPSLHV